MIIHDKFVIGHIPRTGGDAIAAALVDFEERWGLKIYSLAKHVKHDPLPRVSRHKLRVLSIRRLPNWLLGYIMCGLTTGVFPEFTPMALPTPRDIFDPNSEYGYRWLKEDGLNGPLATLPDRYLKLFTGGNAITIDHWLRVENLADDLLLFLKQFFDVDEEDAKQIRNGTTMSYAVKDKTILYYNRDIHVHWTDDQIATIYRNNPDWAAIEMRVYAALEPLT